MTNARLSIILALAMDGLYILMCMSMVKHFNLPGLVFSSYFLFQTTALILFFFLILTVFNKAGRDDKKV